MRRVSRLAAPFVFLAALVLAVSPSAQPERVHGQGLLPDVQTGFMELTSVFFAEANDRIFGPGDVITITGVIPPAFYCPISGRGLFQTFDPFPTADIYVIQKEDGQTLSLGDELTAVTGEANRIIGTSTGAFVNEIVAIVAPAGNLPAEKAKYMIVMDQCMDGILGPFDIVLGNGPGFAFQVLAGDILPDMDLHPIKRKAMETAAMMEGFDVPVPPPAPPGATVKVGACPGIGDFNDAVGRAQQSASNRGDTVRANRLGRLGSVLSLAKLKCDDVTQHWKGIAADPPRFDFDELAELEPLDYDLDPVEMPLQTAARRLANALAEQAAISDALLVTLERFQGAELAEDHVAMVRQLERMDHLISLLSGSGGNLFRTYAALEAFQLALEDAPELASSPEAQELVAFFPEWRRSIGGLLDPLGHRFHLILETDRLVPVGLRAWIQVYLGQDPFLVAEGLPGIPQLRQALGLPPLVRDYPVARTTGPYTAPPGRTIEFDASPSQHPQGRPLTFAWDFEGNGVFDDGQGAVVSRSFEEPSMRLVGVKVSDADGNTDVRYTLVRVGDLTTQDVVVTDSGTKAERGLWHITPEGEVTVIREDAPIPGNLGGFQLDVNGDIVVATSGLGGDGSVIQRFAADGTLVRTIHQDDVADLIGRGITRFGDMAIDGRGDIIVLATPENGPSATPMLLRIAPDGSRASTILDTIADRENWSLDLSGVAIDPEGNIVVTGWGLAPESGEITQCCSAVAVDPDDGSFEFAIPPASWTRPDGIHESVELTFGGERLLQSLAGYMSAGGITVDAQGNYIIPNTDASNVQLYRVPVPPELLVLDFREDTNRLWSGLEVFPLHVRDPNNLELSSSDIALDRGGDALLPGIGHPGPRIGVWRVTPEGVAFQMADLGDFIEGLFSPVRIGIAPEVREVTARDVMPLPNLHITEMRVQQEACPGSVQVGVTLQNLGTVPTEPPLRAHFFDGDPLTGGDPIGSAFTDAPLAPGESVDLEITWADPLPGAREIHVVAAGAQANAPSVALLVCTPQQSETPVVLEPSGATNLVGETQTLEVRLEDELGNPIPDIPVAFEITGTHVHAATVSTDQEGLAVFTYTGTQIGEDTAVAASGDFTSEPSLITWEVDNQPPVADAGGPYEVNEGDTLTLDGSGSFDPDNDPLTFTWDFLDQTFDGAVVDVLVADNLVAVATLTVDDGRGGTDVASAEVLVLNVPPTVVGGEDLTVDEGDAVTLSATFSDPGVLDMPWTVVWEFGDDSEPVTFQTDEQGAVEVDHVYLDDGEYTAEVCVTDKDGDEGCNSLIVTVSNVPPEITDLSLSTGTIDEGDTVTLTGAFTDPGVLDTHAVVIDWGDDDVATLELAAVPTDGERTFTVEHTYLDNLPGDAPYTITVTVTDKDGGADTASIEVVVLNVAPTVEAGEDVVTREGETVVLEASFTDPGLADMAWTVTWDFGDGSPPATATTDSQGAITTDYVYVEAGEYTVEVCIADKDGDEGCDSLEVVVEAEVTVLMEAIWLPPVTNNDFVLRDGTTLPLKFQLVDEDGELITEQQAVHLLVTGPGLEPDGVRWDLGEGRDSLRFNEKDEEDATYVGNFHTRDHSLVNGAEYTAAVFNEDGNELGSTTFLVSTEPGANRGNRPR